MSEAAIGTGAFPAQLMPQGQPPRGLIYVQWAYAPTVTRLLALASGPITVARTA